MHDVNKDVEHDEWAAAYLREPYDSDHYGYWSARLYNCGWYRGVVHADTIAQAALVRVNGGLPLTSRQRATLEDFGIERNLPVVAYIDRRVPSEINKYKPHEVVYSPPDTAVAMAESRARRILEQLFRNEHYQH